jgi:hypothetical protein
MIISSSATTTLGRVSLILISRSQIKRMLLRIARAS